MIYNNIGNRSYHNGVKNEIDGYFEDYDKGKIDIGYLYKEVLRVLGRNLCNKNISKLLNYTYKKLENRINKYEDKKETFEEKQFYGCFYKIFYSIYPHSRDNLIKGRKEGSIKYLKNIGTRAFLIYLSVPSVEQSSAITISYILGVLICLERLFNAFSKIFF